MEKRIDWIDIARGIGILLVVLGHSVTTPIRNASNIAMDIYDSVYYIQVPLLLFVSGLAFDLSFERYQSQPISIFLKSKVQRLLYPYFSYAFIVFLTFSLAHLVPNISVVLDDMSYEKISFFEWVKSLITGKLLYSQHLWYLYSLFVLSVIGFLLIKVFGSNYKYALFALTIILWIFFKKPSDYDIIWKTSIRGLWFGLGALVGARNYSKRARIIIFICGATAFVFKWLVMDSINQESMVLVLKLVVIAGYLFVYLVLAQVLERYGDSFFKRIGKNSLCIYIFHQPFLGSGLGAVLYSILHLPIFLCIILSIAACVLIPLLIERILQHPRLRVVRLFLLGG